MQGRLQLAAVSIAVGRRRRWVAIWNRGTSAGTVKLYPADCVYISRRTPISTELNSALWETFSVLL